MCVLQAATISIEKDWIVRIANNNRALLTRFNTGQSLVFGDLQFQNLALSCRRSSIHTRVHASVLRRIDLLCKLLGPFVFGVYLSLFSGESNFDRLAMLCEGH